MHPLRPFQVYTPAVDEYWSCDYYCAYQEDGHACSRAWLPVFEYGCGGLEMECDTDFSDMGAEAMICECDHTKDPNWSALFQTEDVRKGSRALLGVSIFLMILVCAGLVYQGYKAKEETYGEKPMKYVPIYAEKKN